MCARQGMQETARRTPRACERCRHTRRRCEPPYPCRQCLAAGASCNVRAKARPQRSKLRRATSSTSPDDGGGITSKTKPVSRDEAGTASEAQSHSAVNPSSRNAQRDTFQVLRTLVQDLLKERHGYVFECALIEPPSSKPGGIDSSVSLLAQSDTYAPASLDPVQILTLLTAFKEFMGWQDAKLIDIDALHATACAHSDHLSNMSPSLLSTTVTAHRLPVDSIALIFVALALGAVATGEFSQGRFYFGISTEMVKHFVGRPTLDLCFAYFLQHVFALRAGTSNYAQGIITQVVQNAHDLGLHHNTHGVQGLQLYLLIYMADQYCALTHNTEPTIRTSEMHDKIFGPLSEAEPQLQTFIDLVTTNGYIMEQSHRIHDRKLDHVLELEAKIGNLCSRRIGPFPTPSPGGSFRMQYEPHARIHMLCCRLNLRASGLTKQVSWLSSLCICVHAAQGVLSTYFVLYQPVLLVLAGERNAQNTETDKSKMPVAYKLAVTWRQVKRIMMSAFVVIFAYWHGEMVHEEASRYIAMARLLLEYPRWRWGEKLNEALQTLADISNLSEFRLYEHMKLLLPGVNEQFPSPLTEDLQDEARLNTTMSDLSSSQAEIYHESFCPSESWPSILDAGSADALFGPNVSTIEDQTLLGLWENLEFPIELGFWTGEPG